MAADAEILPSLPWAAQGFPCPDLSIHVQTAPFGPLRRGPQAGGTVATAQREIDPKPVVTFLAQHMPAASGSRADWGDIFGGFLAWQAENGGSAMSATNLARSCVRFASRRAFRCAAMGTGSTVWTDAYLGVERGLPRLWDYEHRAASMVKGRRLRFGRPMGPDRRRGYAVVLRRRRSLSCNPGQNFRRH